MDKTILFWFNQDLSNSWLDFFFSWISQKWEFSIPLLVLICILFLRRFGPVGAVFWTSLVLSILIGDGIGNLLKHSIGQFRPCFELLDLVRIVESPFNTYCSSKARGMPSNHALNYFLAFAFIASRMKSWQWIFPFSLIAILVSLSRIYLGVHYPSQVLSGAIIGTFLGVLFSYISKRILVKFLPPHYSQRLFSE